MIVLVSQYLTGCFIRMALLLYHNVVSLPVNLSHMNLSSLIREARSGTIHTYQFSTQTVYLAPLLFTTRTNTFHLSTENE
jgi:hypothetical protein